MSVIFCVGPLCRFAFPLEPSLPVRVPTPSGKSWFFFLENSRGPGKSWKIVLEIRPGKLFMGVLESPGKVPDFLSVKEWEPWPVFTDAFDAVLASCYVYVFMTCR